MSPEPDARMFTASAIYGVLHDKPLVEFEAPALKTQLSPAEARAVARSLMEAAEASETDAFVVRFFRNKIGLRLEVATQILADFRDARRQIAREQPPPETGDL